MKHDHRLEGLLARRRVAFGLAKGGTALGLGVFGFGCGLIDVDSFRKVRFDLPEKNFSIDAEAQGLKDPPVSTVPTLMCDQNNFKQVCCDPTGVGMIDCDSFPVSCVDSSCQIAIESVTAQRIALAEEVPQLKTVNNNILRSVKITLVKYRVHNQMNVNLPPVDVYVAPEGTKDVAVGSGAVFMVQLPAQAPGFQGTVQVAVPAAGQAAFSRFAVQFKTPFSMLTRIAVSAKGGDPVPQGRADIGLGGLAVVQV